MIVVFGGEQRHSVSESCVSCSLLVVVAVIVVDFVTTGKVASAVQCPSVVLDE